MALIASTVIARHSVSVLANGLSPMQDEMLNSEALFTIVDAPTGAGKSFVFQKAVLQGERVLFLVPTKRLGQNQAKALRAALCDPERAKAEGRKPWTAELAEKKVQCWNGDLTDDLRARGIEDVRAYYASRLYSLNAADGGEIIFATPESINAHFIRPSRDGKFADVGPWTVANHFDRIVYDEFHLIEERGFGIISIIASIAKHWSATDNVPRRARIYLLSATPKEVGAVLSKLGFDTESSSEVRYVSEAIIPEGGRPLHGDVTVEFHANRPLVDILRSDPELTDARPNEKTVIIYDSVRALRDDEGTLIELFRPYGHDEPHIDSGQHNQLTTINSGRHREIENYKVIIGTSTLEVGITIPRTTRMVMNPGMNPLAMIQRIGRAARGDLEGRVVVAIDHIESKPWLVAFVDLVNGLGPRTTIGSFMAAAVGVSSIGRRLDVSEAPHPSRATFDRMGTRAVWASALYHLMLELRLQDCGRHAYAQRVRNASSQHSAAIRYRLKKASVLIGGKKWLNAFLAEAENLRSFAPTITILIEDQPKPITYSEIWIRRHTSILDECPVEIDETGDPYVRCTQRQWERLKERSGRQPTLRRTVYLPDGGQVSVGLNEVTEYIKALDSAPKERRKRDAFNAARELVQYTGIVPFSDAEVVDVVANSTIL